MVIDKENENVRLDRFLKNNCKENTLAEIFKAIRKGNIKVNGKKQKENYRLQLGDVLEIQNLNFVEYKKEAKVENKDLIFYEDKNYIIINKPSGISMHKGTKNDVGLAEMFNIDFANRIDKKTSGLVIGCKNKKSLRHVTELIRENKVIKKYIAETKNNGKYRLGDEFTIKNNLKITDNKVLISNDGLYSESHFKVVDLNEKSIVFEVELITGRKHQIRVQLANIGLPIIGDDKYGNYRKEDKLHLICCYIKFDDLECIIKKPKRLFY